MVKSTSRFESAPRFSRRPIMSCLALVFTAVLSACGGGDLVATSDAANSALSIDEAARRVKTRLPSTGTDTTGTTTDTTTGTTTGTTAPTIVAGVANQIGLNNPSSTAVQNYPLQIGRAFRAGEIASGACPAFSSAGTPLRTQADIKNRWPDGSVKFAVLSTLVPSVPAATRTTLQIGAGTCTTGGSADATRLLDAARNFDVVLEFSGAVTATVSVRDMIAAGAAKTWISGPVTSSWVVADHTGKSFDVGSDSHRSLRPVVHVQQWEGLDLYRIRVILEAIDTTKLQDQSYAVRVSTGLSSRTVQYESPAFTHTAGSRWTKEFWIGSAKPVAQLGINHNIGYLASTRAIPNYDSRVVLSSATVTNILNRWNAAAKGPFSAGMWMQYMPNTGGRPDIGLFPTWHVAMLYSDNPQLQQAVAQQSDLAGAWKMHFRSGLDRSFDDVRVQRGLGLPVTRDGYPTQFLYANNAYMNSGSVATADRFTVISPSVNSGWVGDGAHQPDPWYAMYLVSGDYWYLEQLQFWASWGLFISNPGNATWASGRNPRDTIIQEQVRGMAWTLRTRARAAWASPDSSAEKAYFVRATEQALRQMEGTRIGTSTDPLRSWWSSAAFMSGNPLRFWTQGDAGLRQGITATDVATGVSPWEHSMMIQSLGHVAELDFGANELLAWVSQSWISMITTPGVDPRHMADYRIPVMKTTGGYFQDWIDAFDGYTGWTSGWESTVADLDHGYSIFATAAVSFLKAQTGGAAAWDWVAANAYSKAAWSDNPKMAILPR